MAVVLSGSMRSAALPTTSGRLELLLQRIGVPQAMASRGGSPNPS